MNLDDFKQVVERHGPVVRDGGDWRGRCPTHSDDGQRGDLTFRQSDGKIILHCWGGCSAQAVVTALGLQWSDLFSENGHSKAPAAPRPKKVYPAIHQAVDAIGARLGGSYVADWTYHDAGGEEVLYVVRFDACRSLDGKKSYRPIHPVPGGFAEGDPAGPLPLYRLPKLLADTSSPVVICEGEKAADAGTSIGLLCTTSAHGSSSPQRTDWTPLAGRDCVILPDKDSDGEKYAQSVAGILSSLTPRASVKIVRLPGLGGKGDLYDYIEESEVEDVEAIRENVLRLAAETPVTKPHAGDNCPPQVTKPPLALSPGQLSPVTVESMCGDDIPKPFPMDALPNPLRPFVEEASSAIGCDCSYIVLPSLVGLASAVGNTRRIRLKRSWSEPAVLWGAIIGESGTLKSPALDLALRPIRRRQHEAMERFKEALKDHAGAVLQYEKELSKWKHNRNIIGRPPEKPEEPVAERAWCDDVTIEALAMLLLRNPRGMLVVKDELAGWLAGFDKYTRGQGSDVATWLELHGGRSIVVDRKTGNQTLYVPRGAVSLIGGVQPGPLRRLLGVEHVENGLLARLLVVYPQRKPRQWSDEDVSLTTLESMEQVFSRLYSLKMVSPNGQDQQPLDLHMTPAARQVWIRFYNEHGKEQEELSGDLAATWSKLEGYAARLALVVHLVRWAAGDTRLQDPNGIDEQSILSGISLSRWFGTEAKRFYCQLHEDPERKEVRLIRERLVSWGGYATPRDLQRSLHIPSKTIKAVLDGMVADGVGEWACSPTLPAGGRSTERFHLLLKVTGDKCVDGPQNGGFVTCLEQLSPAGDRKV
jgi:hypothetical protein